MQSFYGQERYYCSNLCNIIQTINFKNVKYMTIYTNWVHIQLGQPLLNPQPTHQKLFYFPQPTRDPILGLLQSNKHPYLRRHLWSKRGRRHLIKKWYLWHLSYKKYKTHFSPGSAIGTLAKIVPKAYQEPLYV